MNLIWATSVSAGSLHAARAISTGRTLIDPSLATAIDAPARAVAAAVADSGCPAEVLWQHLLPLAAGQLTDHESFGTQAASQSPPDFEMAGRQLAARALSQIEPCLSPAAVDRLGLALAQLEAAYVAAQPLVAEQLPLRREPLRGQWEARGPGLLFGVGRLTSADWLVPSAMVILLPPILGGAGQAHPTYNAVTFEAVLANPIARLPEVLRLGWLLAQLHPSLAADATTSSGWRRAAPAALLAVVLAAAEDIELAAADRAHFDLAADAWLGDKAAADTIWRWWQNHAVLWPGWAAGLEALDRLLSVPRA
ncbi:MAG TPA: hypothetical protein VHY91_07810 [Pirellulales bacterium]|jgi:hypothetical protein|nr:hypothetical protein [Pirellulales bacterium]